MFFTIDIIRPYKHPIQSNMEVKYTMLIKNAIKNKLNEIIKQMKLI